MKERTQYEHGAYGPNLPLLNQVRREAPDSPCESGSDTHGPSARDDTHGRNDTHGFSPHQTSQNHVYHGPQAYVTPQPCVSSSETLNHVYHRLDDHIQDVVRKHALSDNSDPQWKALFNLHRELEPVADREGWTQDNWKAAVAFWVKVSQWNGVSLPGIDGAWAEFKRKQATNVEQPFGHALERATARVPDVIVPPSLKHTRWEPVARVMIAFAEEAALRGGATFYLSCRKIAEFANGISPMTALRHLGVLRNMGFVSLVEAGQHEGTRRARKANTWRWHDPPCPGKTEWNSNTTQPAVRRRKDPTVDTAPT